MTELTEPGEPVLAGQMYGPPAPEVIVIPGEQITLRGTSMQMVMVAIQEIRTCGRSASVDTFCGELVARLAFPEQILLDEHAGSRGNHSNKGSEAA